MADTGTMKLLVNTPERVFFNGEATFVELATSEGEIGVYPQHIPLTAVLVPCVLTIHQNDGIKKAAVHGGIVEVLKDKVTILAEIAEWPDEIDVNRANDAKIRAGRANPHILDKIRVDYWGTPTPLQQVANVSVPEARMIQIQP